MARPDAVEPAVSVREGCAARQPIAERRSRHIARHGRPTPPHSKERPPRHASPRHLMDYLRAL
jgi:hypothetical protein